MSVTYIAKYLKATAQKLPLKAALRLGRSQCVRAKSPARFELFDDGDGNRSLYLDGRWQHDDADLLDALIQIILRIHRGDHRSE